MMDLNTNVSTKTIIIGAVIILIFSFAVILSQKKANLANPKPSATLAAVKLIEKFSPSPTSIPAKTPEATVTRNILGTIKEVKKDSIIITDLAGKDIEISFDSSTKVLKGAGEAASAGDIAIDWNTIVVLSENKDSNIAKTIQLVVKNNK